jgi:hypothetical protein
MTVVIFVGPTLPAADVRAAVNAVCLPPAAGGDLYSAALARPDAIGLIDGRFGHTPAVWHKEILWAMAQGIHVFGAAGVGALRAAELVMFGMEGAGGIFDAYRSGVLEDDDEVAFEHDGCEGGYRRLSEPMVNVRATLAAARDAKILSAETSAALEQAAKALFYARRSFNILFDWAAEGGLPKPEIDAFRAWLPRGAVDRMRDDAITLLELMRQRLAAGLPPKTVHYKLEQTEYWQRIQDRAAGEVS